MDSQIIIQYLIVLLSLIVLEGLLSADNAIVLAVMVRHLPLKEQKHALLYGLAGALIFRIIAIFLITILAQYWQIQVLGGLYLLFMAGSHIKEFFDKRKLNQYFTLQAICFGYSIYITIACFYLCFS